MPNGATAHSRGLVFVVVLVVVDHIGEHIMPSYVVANMWTSQHSHVGFNRRTVSSHQTCQHPQIGTCSPDLGLNALAGQRLQLSQAWYALG